MSDDIESTVAKILSAFVGQQINTFLFPRIVDAIRIITGRAAFCDEQNNPASELNQGKLTVDVQGASRTEWIRVTLSGDSL